jgi:hypothetical protein
MPRIEGYSFGRIVVDGEEQTRDVILLPDRLVTNWWRANGHSLVLADLDDVLEELPERLVVGTGAYGRMRPEDETLEQLRNRGVEVETLRTVDAVRRYAELDPAHTAAALHLTC